MHGPIQVSDAVLSPEFKAPRVEEAPRTARIARLAPQGHNFRNKEHRAERGGASYNPEAVEATTRPSWHDDGHGRVCLNPGPHFLSVGTLGISRSPPAQGGIGTHSFLLRRVMVADVAWDEMLLKGGGWKALTPAIIVNPAPGHEKRIVQGRETMRSLAPFEASNFEGSDEKEGRGLPGGRVGGL